MITTIIGIVGGHFCFVAVGSVVAVVVEIDAFVAAAVVVVESAVAVVVVVVKVDNVDAFVASAVVVNFDVNLV